jgi:uncharacterized membrane protein
MMKFKRDDILLSLLLGFVSIGVIVVVALGIYIMYGALVG